MHSIHFVGAIDTPYIGLYFSEKRQKTLVVLGLIDGLPNDFNLFEASVPGHQYC
jgi:hypothetical protein